MLGVYLGLALAGAAPQVLAQAAMAKQFDIKDEIEKKDDLDKKPDLTAKELDRVLDRYFDDLSEFVGDLKKLYSIESLEGSRSLHSNLSSAFERFDIESDPASELTKVLHEHTKLTTPNNQVFIVTRLPRAGLDPLLAPDAK